MKYKKAKIKAIIYDCVKVLLLKNKDIILDPITAEINHLCGTVTNEELFWKKILIDYNLDQEQLSLVKEKIANFFVKNERMYDFHSRIKKRYKTGIINNGTNSIFKELIKKFNLEEDFDVLFNSSKLGIKKPDLEIFKLMAEKLGVKPEECIFIDDNEVNVMGARKVGMIGIVYQHENHETFLKQVKRYVI